MDHNEPIADHDQGGQQDQQDQLKVLLQGLDDDQRAAVTAVDQPLCVLAGAGSGKTLVLTHRIARRILDRSADAQHTLIVTFTRKAANELRQRLGRLGISDGLTIGTFHALAYAELRRRWLDQGRAIPSIASRQAQMVEAALHKTRFGRTANARAVASEISWAKSRSLAPGTYEEGVRVLGRRTPLGAAQMSRVFDAYESEMRKRRIIDYDDLLLLLTQALRSDRAFSSAQRWRFRHFFVDEFQDLNLAQFDLLREWLGGRSDLFMVGDPNQAIYGWNGADAGYLSDASRYFPDIEVIRLKTNYRSTVNVLAAAQAILPSAQNTVPTSTENDRDPGPAPSVRSFATDEDEALGIARLVRAAHRGGRRWADLAVLIRVNAQRLLIERAFHELGVPFRSAGGSAWLRRTELQPVLEWLRESPRNLLAQRFADIEQMAAEFDNSSWEYLDELVSSARQCLAEDSGITVGDFLAWLDVAYRQDGPGGGQSGPSAVTVTTFHRAKGLEWPMVFLAGIEEGLVPHQYSTTSQLDEERRLFYVAITRAREELHCSWARRRGEGKAASRRNPSPWLAPIEILQGQRPLATLVEAAHDAIDKGRLELHMDIEVNVDVHYRNKAMDAIDRWRSARAKLTGVEPKLILGNDVMERIIDLRPTSREELAAVDGFGAVRAASVGHEILVLLNGQVGG